jgi:hypothetical protein
VSRTRILYWFRTPPGVSVGRSALDESAIRSIEDNNPDVEFDWTRILKDQAGPELTSPPPRRAAERTTPRRAPDPQAARSAAPAGTGERPTARVGQPRRSQQAAPGAAPPAAQAAPLPAVRADTQKEEFLQTPAHARLGAEGLLRLRARHAEVLARISEHEDEPARQDELKAQAERLNPDTWVTDDDVRVGVEEYETVLSALRAVVGQARRGSRSGAPQGRSGARGTMAAGEAAPDPDANDEPFPPDRARGPLPDEEPV